MADSCHHGWDPVRSAEKHDVNVNAQPDVIGQVPANMIRVLIDHNLIRIPTPVITVAVVGWSNAEVEAAKPESFPVSSCQPPDMVTAKATPEPPMLPGMVEVVSGVTAAGVMPDPLAVPVNLRRLWRVCPFHSPRRRAMRLCGAVLLVSRLNSRPRRTLARYVLSARMVVAAVGVPVALVFAPRDSRGTENQCHDNKPDCFSHANLPSTRVGFDGTPEVIPAHAQTTLRSAVFAMC
jgi:hypothetical protein